MSNNNLPAPPVIDISPQDMEKVEQFMLQGMPGLDKVAEASMARMMDLYLEGKNYHQIARIMRLPKVLVMYLSYKFGWREMRLEYLVDLEQHLRIRTMESKVASQDFLLQLQHLFQKKIGKKIETYLQTGDESVADSINLKEVDKYVKVVEAIEKITSDRMPKDRDGKPLIGLNLGEAGGTITQVGANSFEVTPKAKSMADKLKEFADMRRIQEAQAKTDKSDINKKDPQQGDPNET